MIDIQKHPIWSANSVNPFKKQAHILRFKLAKILAKKIPRQKFVGVTGSVGKTSTVVACKEVLSELGETISTLETNPKTINLDPIFSLPQTILRITPRIKKVILEMGIEFPGEMDLWLSLVQPATAIVTALGFAHSEFLGDLEKITSEKAKLVEQLPKNGVAILNWDDTNCRKLAQKTQAEVVFFGTDQKNCHIWAGNIRVSGYKIIFELNYSVERVEVHTNLLGRHQIYPLLAASALGLQEGLKLTTIKKVLERIQPSEHRLQILNGINGSMIIDDTYNAAPMAVEEALESLNYIAAKRRIVVLGEMRELGSFSEKMHRQIAQKIYKDKVDLVLLGRGEAKYIADELNKLGFSSKKLQTELDNNQMVESLEQLLGRGDVVLVKGARMVKMNEVVNKLIKNR